MIRQWEPEKSLAAAGAVLLGVLAASLSPAAAGGFSPESAGGATAQFLSLPVSARAAAMGGAQGAVARGASALHYNPAALATLDGGSIELMHAAQFQGITHDYMAIARRLGRYGTPALSIQYLTPGRLDEVANTGAPTGSSFRPMDLGATAGYGFMLAGLDVGAAAKYINSKILNQASGLAFDFGLRYWLHPVTFSASIANVGKGLKFHERVDPLPTAVRLGAGYQSPAWTLAADLVGVRGSRPHLALGLERNLRFGRGFQTSLRGGYNTMHLGSGLGPAAGASVGLGIKVRSLGVEYSWTPMGILGSTSMLSLRFEWDRQARGHR